MVAITTLSAGVATRVQAGGSAAHERPPVAGDVAREAPATIVELSDHARQLVAEANAVQAVLEIFAIANGMPGAREGAAGKEQTVIAHDLTTNEGLYLVVAKS